MFSLKSWAESDIGRRRLNNEDAFFHDQDLGLFIIADGMGGHRGGDRASQLAVQTTKTVFQNRKAEQLSTPQALECAFSEAAKAVFKTSTTQLELRGMGTTLSALVISENQAHIAHIGDSRIYCFRDQRLHQLTTDHSLVNEHVQAGVMSPEEARTSSYRNIITRAIGHNETIKADYISLSVKLNDIFLLCTDGLNSMLLDCDILDILSHLPPEKALKQLILNANLYGGDDNITVILVGVEN